MTDRSDEIFLHLLELRKDLDSAVVRQIVKVYETIAPNIERLQQATHQKLRDIGQTANLAARLALRGKQGPIRCVFLIHMAEAWDALVPVYDAMRAAPDFEPIVVSVPMILRDERGPDDQKVHQELERQRIPHLRFGAEAENGLDILKALQPDILFRQQPWEKLIPDCYDTRELSFTRLCYVPYGYMAVRRFTADEEGLDAHGSKHHTDQNYHRMCWRIFCETEMHKEMFAKMSIRKGDNVIVTGFPKFDRLMERAKSEPPFWPIASRDGKRRPRIIWAPHHSIGASWLGFGTFPAVYKDMLAWAREAGNIEFVLKAHPLLWSELTGHFKFMTQAQVDEYIAAWKALPNAALVEGGDYAPLFAASDMMLTDGISFLSEYPLFEKPLVFLDSGRHCGFNIAGEVPMECANSVGGLGAARELCEKFARGEPDPKAAARKDVLARIRPYPGQSVQKIMDAIRAGLEIENAAA